MVGGMVLETNLKEIASAVAAMNKFEQTTEASAFAGTGNAILSATGLKK